MKPKFSWQKFTANGGYLIVCAFASIGAAALIFSFILSIFGVFHG